MKSKGEVIIPAGCKPWPHELRVASILITKRGLVIDIKKAGMIKYN